MPKTQSPVISLKTAYEIAFSPVDKRAAFIGGRDVTVLDLRNGKPLFAVHPIANPSHIDFSPDGNRLVVKGTSGRTIILNAKTGGLLSDFLNQKEGEGDSALFSNCGRFVVSVSWDGLFSVRDWETTEVVFSQTYPNGCKLGKLCATADRRQFAYSIDRAPRTHNGFTPSTVVVQRWPAHEEKPEELPNEWTAIWGLQISPSGRFLAIVYGTPPNTLEIYDITKACSVARRDWSGGPGCSIAWSGDEKTIIVNGDDNFRVYDLSDLKILREIPVQYACFVQFSFSDRYLALGSWKKSFIIPTDYLDEFGKNAAKR